MMYNQELDIVRYRVLGYPNRGSDTALGPVNGHPRHERWLARRTRNAADNRSAIEIPPRWSAVELPPAGIHIYTYRWEVVRLLSLLPITLTYDY